MEPKGREGKGCCSSAKDTGGSALCSSCCMWGSQAESRMNRAINVTLNVLSLSSSLGKAESSSQNPQAVYFYGKSEVSQQGEWKLIWKYLWARETGPGHLSPANMKLRNATWGSELSFPVQFWNHHVLNIAVIIFTLYLDFHLIFRSIFVSAQTGCFLRARFHLVFPQTDSSNASPSAFGFWSAQPKASLPLSPLPKNPIALPQNLLRQMSPHMLRFYSGH